MYLRGYEGLNPGKGSLSLYQTTRVCFHIKICLEATLLHVIPLFSLTCPESLYCQPSNEGKMIQMTTGWQLEEETEEKKQIIEDPETSK